MVREWVPLLQVVGRLIRFIYWAGVSYHVESKLNGFCSPVGDCQPSLERRISVIIFICVLLSAS